jgi:hypothetical protein
MHEEGPDARRIGFGRENGVIRETIPVAAANGATTAPSSARHNCPLSLDDEVSAVANELLIDAKHRAEARIELLAGIVPREGIAHTLFDQLLEQRHVLNRGESQVKFIYQNRTGLFPHLSFLILAEFLSYSRMECVTRTPACGCSHGRNIGVTARGGFVSSRIVP